MGNYVIILRGFVGQGYKSTLCAVRNAGAVMKSRFGHRDLKLVKQPLLKYRNGLGRTLLKCSYNGKFCSELADTNGYSSYTGRCCTRYGLKSDNDKKPKWLIWIIDICHRLGTSIHTDATTLSIGTFDGRRIG